MIIKRYLRGPDASGEPVVEFQTDTQRFIAGNPYQPQDEPVSALDMLYDSLIAEGQADGVEKLGPGYYRIKGGAGWL